MSVWNAYIYDPRTKTTKRYTVSSRAEGSMSNARQVIVETSKKYGVPQEYILAVPKPRSHRRWKARRRR